MEWEWTDSGGDVWRLDDLFHERIAALTLEGFDPFVVRGGDTSVAPGVAVSDADESALLTWVNGGPLPEGAVRVGGEA